MQTILNKNMFIPNHSKSQQNSSPLLNTYLDPVKEILSHSGLEFEQANTIFQSMHALLSASLRNRETLVNSLIFLVRNNMTYDELKKLGI